MGQALYRKYRSKSLDELVGQEHVTRTLAGALQQGRVSHAYLLTGPRGSGKTSTARILAHQINELPYDGETTHLDIIEIDAASNNGVEDVRDLREKVRLAPTSAKYKVYIIDEVHMLSGAAFNALLKTLEEPPAHAVFILATTEVHKLPATIISRTQRFQFQPVPQDKVATHLAHIAKQEGITIDDDALQLIAAHGDGAFRDSISLLDQLQSAGTHITAETVEQTLGLAPRQTMTQLVNALLAGQVAEVVTHYKQMLAGGASPATLASQLIENVSKLTAQQPALYQLIDQLIDVPRAYNPRLKLEVVLASYALGPSSTSQPIAAAPKGPGTPATPPTPKVAPSAPASSSNPSAPAKITTNKPASPTVTTAATEEPKAADVPAEPAAAAPEAPGPVPIAEPGAPIAEISDDQWQQILATAKEQGPMLYTLLRQAIPHFDADKQLLTLTFRFALHHKRMEEAANSHAFRSILQQIFGTMPQTQNIHNKNAVRHIGSAVAGTTTASEALPPEEREQSTIMSVMGGGEIVNEPNV